MKQSEKNHDMKGEMSHNHMNMGSNENHSDMKNDMDHSMHMKGEMNNHHMSNDMDHSMHMGNLKEKFIVSLFLAIPILILSPMMGVKLPFNFTFKGSEWVVLILSTILFFYGGMPFFKGAKMELKMKSPAMMTLISLGISVSYLYSVYGFVLNNILNSKSHTMNFFWELASLIVIMLLGHLIEMKAIKNASGALQKLEKLLPNIVHRINLEGNVEDIELGKIKDEDIVLVKAGENIPVDGIIIEGETDVNESMVTGEAKLVSKKINSSVIGGTINGQGSIKVKVTGTGETGYLSKIMSLIEKAQKDKSKIETLSNKVAKLLFYVALFTGIMTFVIWLVISKDFKFSLERMVTVFIIACPHALGLAIPLVIARSTSLGASSGLLIRNKEALEESKNIKTIFMDKTGTLTMGEFSVSIIKSFDEKYDENEILSIFASLESHSNHPLATGILKFAKEKDIKYSEVKDVKNISGVGLTGEINEKEFLIVNKDYLIKNKINYDEKSYIEVTKEGDSVSFLLNDKKVLGLISQNDKIKKESFEMMKYFTNKNIEVIMLTGDNKESAEKVAKELNIKNYYASLLPENKEEIIIKYQKDGKKVMMVGDGINDAPSLIRSNIGVAIGAGTDVAIDSADVVLVKSNPYDIVVFLVLAKRTMKKMIQNIWWGAGYNIIAIPLAAGVLYPLGINLSPAVGAILMSLSTVIVALNAMTLNLNNIEK